MKSAFETSQERRWLFGTGRGRVDVSTGTGRREQVDDSTYRFPTGVRNIGLITQKTWIRRAFAQFSRWRVETSQERRWHFGTGRGRVDVSTISPIEVRNKGLITKKTWIRRAFAQFSRWRVETSQERRRHTGTGRGKVDDSTVSPQGSEI